MHEYAIRTKVEKRQSRLGGFPTEHYSIKMQKQPESLNDSLTDGAEGPRLKAILMIEPCSFGFNEETAGSNYFQQNITIGSPQENALREFADFVSALRSHDISVVTVKDTPSPRTPDSIFPNNWISFHERGRIVLYPMYAKNRRAERKQTVLDAVAKQIEVKEKIALTDFESVDKFLEGTGSMVLDRINNLAYACLSPRTHSEVLDQFCHKMGYRPILFHAQDQQGNEIYHTNVLMCVADRYVVICLEAIKNPEEKKLLQDVFTQTGKEIIEISHHQMNHFCGNMLQVESSKGEKYLVMSTQAYSNLSINQIERLNSFNPIIHSKLDTIETLGGGSARCMMAEVYG